jgi:hypothetical protein
LGIFAFGLEGTSETGVRPVPHAFEFSTDQYEMGQLLWVPTFKYGLMTLSGQIHWIPYFRMGRFVSGTIKAHDESWRGITRSMMAQPKVATCSYLGPLPTTVHNGSWHKRSKTLDTARSFQIKATGYYRLEVQANHS